MKAETLLVSIFIDGVTRRREDAETAALKQYPGYQIAQDKYAGITQNGIYWRIPLELITVVLPKATPKRPSVLDSQVGGSHYRDKKIQPWEAIVAWGLDYFRGDAVSYIARSEEKGGAEDILKAIHYLRAHLEFRYGIHSTFEKEPKSEE